LLRGLGGIKGQKLNALDLSASVFEESRSLSYIPVFYLL
jgi:hypothetical protein